jgi:hypothetical protein
MVLDISGYHHYRICEAHEFDRIKIGRRDSNCYVSFAHLISTMTGDLDLANWGVYLGFIHSPWTQSLPGAFLTIASPLCAIISPL